MTTPLVRPATAVVLAMLTSAACTSATRSASSSAQPISTTTGEIGYIAKARADSVNRPYTEADIHFMSGMISHHAQAIAMANWAPTHGASEPIRVLAARIINAQTDEIAIMQNWLRDRRQPVPEPSPRGMKMAMGGEEHVMLMPGMLTEEQMQELDAATGKEFDRLFLTFMIQHHQGAVSMVKDLFATNGAGQDELVFKLASDVNVDQTTEIARMRRMLFDLAVQSRSQ